MLEWLYEKLWRPTTQRPWTYAMRQTAGWKVAIGSLIAASALYALSVYAGLPIWAIAGLWFAGGFLAGHLFWDTPGKYIKHKEEFADGSRSW